MIVAHAHGDDPQKTTLIIGLSQRNLHLLMEGMPIPINQVRYRGVLPEGWEIVICFGKTEEAILEEFRSKGLLP